MELICEIGVNHCGSLATAMALASEAKACGCDAVKTQLWTTERVYLPERWDEMKALELSRDDIAKLKVYCENLGVELIVTPDEIEDAIFLADAGFKRIKTSSQDITNLPFLNEVAKLGLPMIVSTGACSQEEMNLAVFMLAGQIGDKNLTVLHCVSAYPAPDLEMNVRVIERMRQQFYGRVGLSDHCMSTTPALLAVACGATVFEKHLTFDRTAHGPDHAASLHPEEMKQYVDAIRRAAVIMGNGIKRVMPCEQANRARYEQFIAPRIKGV